METGLLWGVLFGARHAFDADHLAALGTLISGDRSRAVRLGLSWALGHSLALFAAQLVVALVAPAIPWAHAEIAVVAILVLLGARSLFRSFLPPPSSEHASHKTSLAVGVVHGLAGTGSLLLLLNFDALWYRLAYVSLFGVGLAVATACAALLLVSMRKRLSWRAGQLIAGAFSIVCAALLARGL